MTFNFRFFLLFTSLLLANLYPISAEESATAREEAEVGSVNYQVQFQGTDNKEIMTLLDSVSQLTSLKDNPPTSVAALKRRIENDIPNLLKALQGLAYYQAKIDYTIDETKNPVLVTITFDTGPEFPFASFEIIAAKNVIIPDYVLSTICSKKLGIIVGEPALPAKIFKAEDKLNAQLELEGYPLSKVVDREIEADLTKKSISVIFHIDPGPAVTFGQTTITGDEDVLIEFFERKINWQTGEKYDPIKVVKTFNALEASGLFSAINISHANEAESDNSLPMTIDVKEAKHRSIAFGVGYATDLGFGVNGEWEHRNIRGIGEKVRVVANLWQIKQEGFIQYIQHDIGVPHQDLIWKAEVQHEITKGFRESSLEFSATFERQLTDNVRISYGALYSLLRNSHSNNNGNFNLFKFPLQFMWTKTNSLLDPTDGMTLLIKSTPALQTLKKYFAYSTNLITTTAYKSVDENRRVVFAGKATVGSILGSSDRQLPPSERFYAGSDNLLRGYTYMTVSPLNRKHKPIGGRSLMVFSLESRLRVYDPFAVVLFYDVGNVYLSPTPQFNHKQLQSTGIGVRYHTPVGPLRVDLAFPLNRRPHLDSAFQLYFSVGQAF